jgi:serine/threonine protein kinase
MNADQWPRVKDIFHAAIERAPGNRAAFVLEACGTDEALRAEVERLIAAHERATGFIEHSPVAGAQSRHTSLSGHMIGRYEVGRLLGAGGMGEVYAARDVELGRQVALKVATGVDAHAQTRLRREAQHASQLNHPHICTIHEVGAADGQSYIVMEYVDGERLSDIIPTTGLPVETVLRYGIQIADALAHAHRNGVTHRDLKSANIAVTSEGRAKVLDFGLARRHVPGIEKSLTAEGSVAGTLAYMAPELLRGKDADACSDIWALGVVLHEMAAGSRPFGGGTGFEQSGAILHEPPAPLPGRIPASLQQIIRRCLAKDPRERYHQANEIRSALETAQVGVGGGEPFSRPPVPPPVPPSASAITVLPVSPIRRLLTSPTSTQQSPYRSAFAIPVDTPFWRPAIPMTPSANFRRTSKRRPAMRTPTTAWARRIWLWETRTLRSSPTMPRSRSNPTILRRVPDAPGRGACWAGSIGPSRIIPRTRT